MDMDTRLTTTEISRINDFVAWFRKAHPEKKILYLCVAGSHMTGTKRAISDVDLRGVFVDTLHNRLLGKDANTISRNTDWDVQMHSIEKFLNLLSKSNLNCIEWVLSGWTVINEYKHEFEQMANKSLSMRMGNHARGWAYSMYKMDWDNPKKCMYAIRPLLTYIHLLDKSEFISDIGELAKQFDIGLPEEFGFTLKNHISVLKHANETGKSVNRVDRHRNNQLYGWLIGKSKELEQRSDLSDAVDISEDIQHLIMDIRIDQFDSICRYCYGHISRGSTTDKTGKYHSQCYLKAVGGEDTLFVCDLCGEAYDISDKHLAKIRTGIKSDDFTDINVCSSCFIQPGISRWSKK